MAKNNNTLVFNGLMQGMSWDLIKEAKDEIKRHLGEKQPTRKDILTDWIIGKDYMLQLLGNSYQFGGGYSTWLNQYKKEHPLTDNKTNYSWGELSKGKLEDSFSNGNGFNSALGIAGTALDWTTGFMDSVNSIDNSAQLNDAKYIAGQQINFGDNASLMNTLSNLQYADTNTTAADVGGHTFGQSAMNVGKDIFSGATTGLTVGGPWGAVIGGAAGLAKGVIQEIVTNNKAKDAAETANLISSIANDQINQRMGYASDKSQLLATLYQLQHTDKNGGKLKKSHKFANGGLLNNYFYGLEEVNAGGSHEENPNEGVVVSYAPDGLPNKVEEGETIHNDYVYSKRLEANEKVLENNLLDKKYKGKSFADISKKLTEDRKKRPNDPISVRTNEENLNRLQDALEELKLDNKTREVKRFLGSLNNDLLNALQLEMMDEYEAYTEQLAQQLEQEDLAYQEEQAALEGMFGKGGVLQYGGDLRDAARLIDNLGKEETLNDKLTKHAADVYFYITHPKAAIDAAKRRYRKENELFKKTPYGNLVSSPIPSITNTYENIKDGSEDYKARKSVERLIKYESDRLQGKERRKYPSDYLWDFVNKVTGYPSLISDKKSNNRTFNRGGHLKQGTYGSSYLESEYPYGWQFQQETDRGFDLDYYNHVLNIPEYDQIWNLVPKVSTIIDEKYALEPDDIPITSDRAKMLLTLGRTGNTNVAQNYWVDQNPTLTKDYKINLTKNSNPVTVKTVKTKNNNFNSSLAPLRFAEAFGSAGLYLSDILGLTNQPDYSNARMYQRAIDNIGGVNFTPIGNYLTYTPIDTEYLANQLMATAAARRNYGNVAGNYTLGLLGDYNTLNQIGATTIAARQQDLEQKNKVAEFNRATNDRNSAMSLDAQKQNAALRALRALEYRYLADMMTKERDINEAARAANYQNFMSNLAAIGREDFNYDQIKWMIDHGVFPVGAESYLTGLKI